MTKLQISILTKYLFLIVFLSIFVKCDQNVKSKNEEKLPKIAIAGIAIESVDLPSLIQFII